MTNAGEVAVVSEEEVRSDVRQEDLEHLARLRVIDDDFMRCVFRDQPELTQRVVRILTGIPDIVVNKMETQRDLKRLHGAHSAVLDVWCTDANGTWYDVEVQRGDNPDAKRSRYYSAIMDVEVLGTGLRYAFLPEQWVLFVMEKDSFGKGAPFYRFERRTADGMVLEDETHILYANAQYRGEDDFGKLMADFMQVDPGLMQIEELRNRVQYLKNDEKGVSEMCEIFDEIRREGEARGRESSLLDNLRTIMETMNLTAQQAMDALRIPDAKRARLLTLL